MPSFRDLINMIEAEEKALVGSSPTKKPVTSATRSSLFEGRHDDLVKQTIDSVQSKTTEDDTLANIINDYEQMWKRIRGSNSFQNFHNKWKYYIAFVLRQSLLLAMVKNGVDDPKLKNKITMKSMVGTTREVKDTFDSLVHFMGINYRPIQQFDPNANPDTAIEDLSELEAQWKELVTEDWLEPDGSEEMILDLGDYKWFDLHRPYCSDEGDAMGHCGNAGYSSDETILSLRQVKEVEGVVLHRPSLTFILDGDGLIGESKGRANNKPSQKYHRHIVALLKLDRVKGIKGGGYMPGENFKISDLSPEDQEEVINSKGEDFLISPDVRRFREILSEFIDGTIDAKGFQYRFMDIMNSQQEEHDFRSPGIYINGEKSTPDRIALDIESLFDTLGSYRDILDHSQHLESFVDIDLDDALDAVDSDKKDELLSFIASKYQDDIASHFDEDEDSIDEDFVDSNLVEIDSEILDGELEMLFNSAASSAHEVSTFSHIYEECIDHISGILSNINLVHDNLNDIFESNIVYVTPKHLEEFIDYIPEWEEEWFEHIDDIDDDVMTEDDDLAQEIDEAINRFIEDNQ